MLARRSMLAGLGASAAVRARAEELSLRRIGAAAGLLIGSSSEVAFAQAPDYEALTLRNCDLFAPNMSWQRLQPTPGANLSGIDPNIAPVLEAGLALTGYHLLWHQRTPAWLASLSRIDAERAVRDYINAVASRFGRTTFSWNVVNEAIQPSDRRSDGLRRGPLLDLFGPTMFDLAFGAAQAAAPGVLRVYNDYDLELVSDGARRIALLRLIDSWRRRGVPVQAIGLQCHLRSTTFDRFGPTAFRRFLAELAARDLVILITELDVQDFVPGDIPARDRRIADIYRRFLDVALDERRVGALTFWGLSDHYTWWNDPARPSFLRPDGLAGRSLLFDRDMRPKPALFAVMDAIRAAPKRPRLIA